MKLIQKYLVTNTDTFSPELEATLRIPIEIIRDASALGTDEIYETLGRALVEVLTEG